jgi:hypothetical protein
MRSRDGRRVSRVIGQVKERRRLALASLPAAALGLLLLATAAPAVADEAPAAEAPAPAPADPAAPAAGGQVMVAAAPAAPEPTPMPAVATTAPPATPVAPPVPPPPPYSLPWQLRPLTVGNVVRSDTAVAFYENAAGDSGSTVATMLLASYKVTPNLAPMVRLGFVENAAPGMGVDGRSFINPVVGATYSHKISDFRLAGFGGVTIPIGMGGGSMPEAGPAGANAAGIAARSGMDNAMYAVNYMTIIAGAGFGYIANKLTVQAEITILQLFRVKGSDTTAISPDSTRTNSTAGLHAGYFIIPQLSLGGELRYQRWLARPTLGGMKIDSSDIRMDTVTMAVGPRMHFKVGNIWLRPGIAYARGLDKPLTNGSYNMVQVDIPVVF